LAYDQIAEEQGNLYDFIYRQLMQLVGAKKNKSEWMGYTKVFIEHPFVDSVLPPTLPRVDLNEFDASQHILKALENSPTEAWPLPTSIVVKEKSEGSRSKGKRLKRASIVDDINLSTSDEDLGACASAAEVLPAPQQEIQKPLSLTLKTPEPFKYALRVLRWFEATSPLDPTKFPEYAEARVAYQKLMIAYHAFTCTVDAFLIAMALKLVFKDHTSFVLPAEVFIKELGKKSRGVFTYCMSNKTGEFYHRFFSDKQSDREIIQKISNRAFSEADFPSLDLANEAHEKRAKSDPQVLPYDSDETIDSGTFWGTTRIKNNRTGDSITLFPVKPG
jgi:hypothetical protein